MSVPAQSYGYLTAYWQAPIAAAAPDLPIAAVMQWIAMESGGNPAAAGAVSKNTGGTYEAGLTQIDFDDPPQSRYGYSLDQIHGNGTFASSPNGQWLTRKLTSDEESTQVAAAIAHVRAAKQEADDALSTNSLSWSIADAWSLAKLWHCLPTFLSELLPTAGSPSSYGAFKAWALAQSPSSLPSAMQPYAGAFNRYFTGSARVGAAVPSGPLSGQPIGLAALDLTTALAIVALAFGAYYIS